MRSDAASPEEYLAELDPDRRELVGAIRNSILSNLPDGYEEAMEWGMLTYQIPLDRYPDTYNGKPLAYVSLASQKNYVSLYLMSVYGDDEAEEWFHERYERSGKKLDMGKSCVRFRRLDDLPLDVLGDTIGAVAVDDFVGFFEEVRGPRSS
jgi:hypothetical protein